MTKNSAAQFLLNVLDDHEQWEASDLKFIKHYAPIYGVTEGTLCVKLYLAKGIGREILEGIRGSYQFDRVMVIKQLYADCKNYEERLQWLADRVIQRENRKRYGTDKRSRHICYSPIPTEQKETTQ